MVGVASMSPGPLGPQVDLAQWNSQLNLDLLFGISAKASLSNDEAVVVTSTHGAVQ